MNDWIKTTLETHSFEFAWQRYFDLRMELPLTAPLFDDELRKAVIAAAGDLEQGEWDLRHRCEADSKFAREMYDSLRVPVVGALIALLEEELARFKEMSQ